MLTAVPDLPPKIAFTGPVEISPRGAMLFRYKVEDDHGVVSAEARIERVPTQAGGTSGTAPAALQIGKPPIFALSLPRAPVKSAEAKTYRDLTAHPWAGLPVVVTLVARDEAGHESLSAARGVILPERKFIKPLAKAIAEQRRSLVEEPGRRFRVAGNLNALAMSGADEGIPSEILFETCVRLIGGCGDGLPPRTSKASPISSGTRPYASRTAIFPPRSASCARRRTA